MNSASSAKTYIKMQGQILEDDDCACFLVEAIAKKSQNIKWTTKVDGKNVQHRLIRRVSMDQFYAVLTEEADAFRASELFSEAPGEMAMAMAVYMLGFNTYMGFGNEVEPVLGADKDGMLKRIYAFAKQ